MDFVEQAVEWYQKKYPLSKDQKRGIFEVDNSIVIGTRHLDDEQYYGPWLRFYRNGHIQKGLLVGGKVWETHEAVQDVLTVKGDHMESGMDLLDVLKEMRENPELQATCDLYDRYQKDAYLEIVEGEVVIVSGKNHRQRFIVTLSHLREKDWRILPKAKTLGEVARNAYAKEYIVGDWEFDSHQEQWERAAQAVKTVIDGEEQEEE